MANYEEEANYQTHGKAKFTENKPERFVIDHGAAVVWERSFLCACRMSTGNPNPNCPICHGTGFAFLEGKNTQVNLQSMKASPANVSAGVAVQGSAFATTLTEDKMAVRDRISFNDTSIPASVLVNVDTNAITHGISLRFDVKSIEHIQLNSNGNLKELAPEDLNIDIETNIFYPTEDMLNAIVSLNMLVTLRFYVVDIIREGRYQYNGDARYVAVDNRKYQRLPQFLLLRREDIFIPDVINDQSGDGKVTSAELDPKRAPNINLEGFL